jgi:hypothetical protein
MRRKAVSRRNTLRVLIWRFDNRPVQQSKLEAAINCSKHQMLSINGAKGQFQAH